MLFELHIKYEDGRTERPIIYADKGEDIKIHPQRDKILDAGCKRFKYRVVKHDMLPTMIVKLGDRTLIYPSKIECHPKTTLDDIIEIQTKEQIKVEKKVVVEKPQVKSWRFESSSGGGEYFVTETSKGLKCSCPGSWRAKDRRCRHIREVETY